MTVPSLTPKRFELVDNRFTDVQYFAQTWSPDRPAWLLSSWNIEVYHDVRKACGYDTAQFNKLRREGQLIPYTPWYKFESRGECTGAYSNTWHGAGDSVTKTWCAGPDSTAWIISEEEITAYSPVAYDMYVTQAAASIYESGWDALTFLAELTQLKSLIMGAVKHIMNLRRVPKTWRTLSSAWLSYRYGWTPLVSDLKAINELISSISSGMKRHKRSAKGVEHTSSRNATPYTDFRFDYERVVTDDITIMPNGIVCADIAVPEIQFNPLQTGWELIPFSFAIDWFLNVGKTLSAIAVISGATSYVAAKGYKIRMERTESINILSEHVPPNISITWVHNGRCTAELTRRTPCSIPIIPRPALRVNWKRILDALALVVQRLK